MQKCTIDEIFPVRLPVTIRHSVIVIKSQEKAQDCEKDDNVAGENQSTRCPRNLEQNDWDSKFHFLKRLVQLTVGAPTGALAKTIGKAKADKTMPVVKNAQTSFKADDSLRLSVYRREMSVGIGDNR